MRPVTAIGLLAALAACQQGETSPAPSQTSSPALVQETQIAAPIAGQPLAENQAGAGATDAAGDTCGAGKLDRWLNVLPTDDVKADIERTIGERPVRIYTQGDPITMDFSEERLNVELGTDGRIKRFRCG